MNKNHMISRIAVSSSRSAKDHIIDSRQDTCWTSVHGKGHYVRLELEGHVDYLEITFQAGFQPRRLRLSSENFESLAEVAPGESTKTLRIERTLSYLHIDLVDSYDPYGRVCVYLVELF